ncbi:long-chain-fatty-acid--CoA ligase [Agromyces archimandritae]|uniref:AMP-binding protein n=1 Tax=Agromyces archimandritae TaxID=2781962 RepID=A0A975FLW6_9MICO|nr:long-chain-fatty-acid--CoA ligase [Agromyces archimandritae]QTX04142.1 AMP-binding protein [Agromyces archimandritae]
MDIHTPRPWLDSYAEGVPSDVEAPRESLFGIIEASVDEYPDHVALEFFGRETTYAELGEQIAHVAEGLRRLGVQKGDPVAIVLPNCPQHVVAFYAILRLGGIVVEHNPLYTPRELRHQFEDHRARVVIAWDKVVGTIRDFPDDIRVPAIVSVDVTRSLPGSMRFALRLPVKTARESRAALTNGARGTTTWEALMDAPAIDPHIISPDASDVALIQYTSGTTGSPKGAMLTHANLGVNAAQARAWVPEIERGSAVVYAVLPMFHAYGLTLCLTFAMSMGARLVLFPSPDPALVLKAVKRHPPTFLPAVPPIYDRLTKRAVAEKVSLQGIRIAISGAMPLSAAVVEPWEELTGGYLVEGYGLSECSPVLMANPVAPNRRAGTVGLPLPSTEVRIVDPDAPENERPAGEAGELTVRGPQVFGGYWGKAEETEAVFVADPAGGAPWFRTGDIVEMDADGFVRIVDRIKELIITGGFNVMPSEVEAALRGYPGIQDIAVVGIPDARDGEHVVAAVVMEDGRRLDEAEVRAWARKILTPYKVPRRVIAVDELPKSIIGKVVRRQVRDRILEQGL